MREGDQGHSKGRKNTQEAVRARIKTRGYLVSKYINNPHLINKHKYDLRLYVLVTSFDPLKIYLYNDGLVRFATEEYTNANKSSKKRYVHLTNYSVNKNAPKFERNSDPEVTLFMTK